MVYVFLSLVYLSLLGHPCFFQLSCKDIITPFFPGEQNSIEYVSHKVLSIHLLTAI